jgi:hypothetical protein
MFKYDITRLSDLEKMILLTMNKCVASDGWDYYWLGYDGLEKMIYEVFNVIAKLDVIRTEMKYLVEDKLVIFEHCVSQENPERLNGSGYFLTDLGSFVADECKLEYKRLVGNKFIKAGSILK